MIPVWNLVVLALLISISALDSIPRYNWEEYSDLWHLNEKEQARESLSDTSSRLKKPLAEEIVGKPIYLGMTTISNRLYGIGDTIESLVGGDLLPSRVFVFISEEPHLLDGGIGKSDLVSDQTSKLRSIYSLYPHISIVYVDNIGPHRKLLPLLSEKWDEDCLLVTVDDHEIYPQDMLSGLIDYYIDTRGLAVVARRARRMGICSGTPPWSLCPYTNAKRRGLWPETKPARYEMLMLPTGTGGVLYRPAFFHPSVFDKALWEATLTGDDLMFRLGTMSKGVPVVTTCCQDQGLRAACPPRSTSRRSIGRSQEIMKQRVGESWGQFYTDQNFFEKSHDLKLKKRHSKKIDVQISSKGYKNSGSKGKYGDRKEIKEERARAREIRKKKRRREQQKSDQKVSSNSANLRVKSQLNREQGQGGASAAAASPESRRILDNRKEVSLATKFNNIGGNSAMWARATKYLKQERILDFDRVLSNFARYEREHCLLMSSILGPGHGTHQGVVGTLRNWWEGSWIAIQNNLWDSECGIHLCKTHHLEV